MGNKKRTEPRKPRPDRARTAGEGMRISPGIMLLMYRIGRLVALVYIR
jgi:hypothetical protein